jgi:hypothetical protein
MTFQVELTPIAEAQIDRTYRWYRERNPDFADRWLLSEYTDPNTILTLSSFDLQLSIADLYENIDFEDT